MSLAAQKTPLAISLQNAAQKKVQDAIALLGKALPAQIVLIDRSGTIATVKFLVQTSLFTLPNVQCPVATSQFARAPLGAGVQGVVWSADTYLGGVSGLGGGNADLSLPGNLSALIFIPVGNTAFAATDDPNAYVLYGPDGVILRDSQSRIKLKLQPTVAEIDLPVGVPLRIRGAVIIEQGLALGGSITAADGVSVYADDIKTAGNVVAGQGTGDQVDVLNHTHKYNNPTGGSTVAETQAPTAGT